MIGTGRSGSGDELGSFEFLRIETGSEGEAVYVAAPGGGTPSRFKLVRSDGTSAIFENSDHDFPQRISYTRNGDSLAVAISTLDGSQEYA